MNKKASILIVSGNLSSRNARACLKSLKANTPPELVREVIIIEAGVRPDFNHAAEINKAMRMFSGDWLVLLDDDVVLAPGWLEGLIACAEQCGGAGVVGAVLRNRRGEIITSGGDVTDTYFGVDQKEAVSKPVERKYVTSAVMLITRRAAETIGPFDERFRKYGQDADYCFRAWEAGFRVMVSPGAQAAHDVGKTVTLRQDMQELFEKDKKYFYSKWRQSKIYGRFEVIDLTQRGVLHLGSPSDARYDGSAGEKQRPLEELMREADGLRSRHGFSYVDIIGGEKAEQAILCKLVAHCRAIGLLPAVVTDGRSPETLAELVDAGLEDMVIRVHGQREADGLIGRTVELLRGKKFGFRIDSMLYNFDYTELPELAGAVAAMGPRMANLIFPGPHEEPLMAKGGFPSTYADAAPLLREAIGRLAEKGIWTNVKYFPLCLLKGCEQNVCNAHQQPWDPYEPDCLPAFKLDRKEIKRIRRRADREGLYGIFPEEKTRLWLVKHRICGKNFFFEQCAQCANRAICDGMHPQYAAKFGNGGFVPLEGEMIRDPLFYRKKNQQWRMTKPKLIPAEKV
ncbi:MAG: glycosyltransferase [Chitinispirillaceae bacterium]|nr:glycosyltransferase [Chitinispirillaceae bacterium]